MILTGRLTVLLAAAFLAASVLANEDVSTWELENIIEKKVAYYVRAPCNVSIGFLVHMDTRCRFEAPLTLEDSQRGVLRRIVVNIGLVCRKPVGDIAADYTHVYEEGPEKVWTAVAVRPRDRASIKTACE